MFLNTLILNPAYFFAYILIIIVSITVHELAHGFAAISQGDVLPASRVILPLIQSSIWVGIR